MSRAPKGTPTGTNLAVLLDYIDGKRETEGRLWVGRPQQITAGMLVDLGRVAPTSAPHLRRCIAYGMLDCVTHERGSVWKLTPHGVDVLRAYCAAFPTLGHFAERFP